MKREGGVTRNLLLSLRLCVKILTYYNLSNDVSECFANSTLANLVLRRGRK